MGRVERDITTICVCGGITIPVLISVGLVFVDSIISPPSRKEITPALLGHHAVSNRR